MLTEGPQGVTETYSGGTDNADNSGTLRYVRIEFAGYDVSGGAGQELNSLSHVRRRLGHHAASTCSRSPAWTTPSSGGAARWTAATWSPTSRATTTSTGPRATAAATSS